MDAQPFAPHNENIFVDMNQPPNMRQQQQDNNMNNSPFSQVQQQQQGSNNLRDQASPNYMMNKNNGS